MREMKVGDHVEPNDEDEWVTKWQMYIEPE